MTKHKKPIDSKNEHLHITSATRHIPQQWFSVGIFPPKQLFGLISPLRVDSYVNPIKTQMDVLFPQR